ncbi:hypothetical protein GUJ93_ZPchr0002g23199 [Zizania palustris]|uniref:Uncharacterized protein n=1 Tax=Zizania palustris TaxID=103762 RepID=A0A8J5RT07_ZIZPA|nr:hypothetical protein GUJ93_ZPchr0002g23199 [Zizania palustris]
MAPSAAVPALLTAQPITTMSRAPSISPYRRVMDSLRLPAAPSFLEVSPPAANQAHTLPPPRVFYEILVLGSWSFG